MALTAQPWSPTPHEGGGVADFLPQRLSLDGREVSPQPAGASQLEGLYTAFSQSLQMPGPMAQSLPATSSPASAELATSQPAQPSSSAEAVPQRRPLPKSASDEDVFSAIGGLEISRREPDVAAATVSSGAAAVSTGAAPVPHSGTSIAPPSLGAAPLVGFSAGGFSPGPSIGDLPQDETPSRTLIVRDLDPKTDAAELQKAFEAYGEVRTLYTAALARGFIMITYFDLRAACLAMHSLQGASLGGALLDIHFSTPREGGSETEGNVTLYNLDTTVSLEKLYQSFVTFGDVKDVHGMPGRPDARIIEFYDVRHATAAYAALSQGVASKRGRTRSFDMAALPSVPELNASQMPSQTSQESLAAMTATTNSWDSKRSSHDHMSAAMAASAPPQAAPLGSSPSVGGAAPAAAGGAALHPPLHPASLGDHSLGGAPHTEAPYPSRYAGADLAQQHSAQLAAMQAADRLSSGNGASSLGGGAGLGPSSYGSLSGTLPNSGSAGALSDMGLPGGNYISGTLPPGLGLGERQLSGQMPPPQRLSASGSVDHLQRLSSSGHLQHGGLSHGSSFGNSAGAGMGSAAGGPLGGRLGSADGGVLAGGVGSAAVQRLQSLGSTGLGSLPPGIGYEAAAANERAAALGASRSANDLAALYEAQQAQLQQALLQQQRTLQALHSANSLQSAGSLHGSSQQMYMSPSAASFSPGSSPGAGSWGGMPQAELLQAQQVHAALVQAAGTSGLSVGQLQALLAAQSGDADGAGGAPALMRSQSASAMQQNARLAAALQAQGAAAQLAGRLGPRDRADSGGFGGASGGNRFSRRGPDGSQAAERRSAQERLYSLDLDRVLAGHDARTTLMIKNIPNKYTQKMLLATIDEHFRGTYDFFYLPIDFKNKCNVGYAFINMLQPGYVVPLVERFNKRKWEKFNSEKVCSITYARIQGKNAMVAHFQNSSLLHEDKRCRPVLFHSTGSLAGEPEQFPVGPNSRLRASRTPARDTHREHKLREREVALW